MAIRVAEAGHRLVEHVPRHPQAVEVEGGGADVALDDLVEALARAGLGEQEAVAVLVLDLRELLHHVVRALA